MRKAAETLRGLGATVDEVSVPMHTARLRNMDPHRGGRPDQPDDEWQRHGHRLGGLYTTSLLDFHANWRSRADELSDTLKVCMFIGEYFLKHHRGHFYAKSQNLSRKLKAGI